MAALPDDPAVSLGIQQAAASQTTPSGSPSDAANSTVTAKANPQQAVKEEHPRILGIIPTRNVTDNQEAGPLTPKEKFSLFFRSTTDPWVFFLASADAGISQAKGDFPEYGQGVEGYAKRLGASYADTFDGNLWGNAILTTLWHEDPRFYRKGEGSFSNRFLWAAATTVWCKRDNGTWGPNYANVAGNFIGGAISNIYYPESQRGVSLTLTRGATVTAEGTIGAELLEFWPDIERHYLRKRAEKAEKEAAQQDAQHTGAAPAVVRHPPEQP
jgi:hypothetical protein